MLRIGIVANRFKSTFGITDVYLNFAAKFGRPSLILPPSHLKEADPEALDEEFGFVLEEHDVILLPGGADILSHKYGGVPSYFQTMTNPFLECFDTHILPRLIECEKPIFGICRGMQSLNVALGGTLLTHLWNHPVSRAREELIHKVGPKLSTAGGFTKKEPQRGEFKVNSLHHQAIDVLGAGFESVIWSEDNFVEAIAHDSLPMAGVQWHPEHTLDQFTLSLFDWVVLAAR